MPELPELEAIRLRLGPRLQGRRIEQVRINREKGFLLRHPPELLAGALAGLTITGLGRRGKHLLIPLAGAEPGLGLVVNPMLGGRFQFQADPVQPPAAWIFALELEGGGEFRYLDFRDMGRVYLTSDPGRDVPAWSGIGPEADSLGEVGMAEFRRKLRRHRDALKDLLRNQAFVAGIGNAYSDEILFDARLLPLRRRATLTPEEEERLFESIPRVLKTAIDQILANPDYEVAKQDRRFMKVHGKADEACPRCGHRISSLGSAREATCFCRGCQS